MPYKVPDWKVYQVGKHTPELEQVQRMLSSLGLKVSWSCSKTGEKPLSYSRIPGFVTRFGGLTDECLTWQTDPC